MRKTPPPLALLAVWTVFVAHAFAQSPAPVTPPQRPFPEVEHVVIISIDGLRPDRALLADMPTLRGMLRAGAYTFWARTTAVSVTLPSHTSMVTGVIPGKHGIEWNRDLPLSEPVYPNVPTVMEMATRAGYVTAMVAGKSKFSTLNKPGTITHTYIPTGVKGDNDEVVVEVTKIIEAHKPQLLFLHFPDVDTVGHKYGWGSAEQLAQIEKTDTQLAKFFAALDRAGIRQSTVVILSADHGGAGLTHGAEDFRSRHIPWIATGPATRKFFDLTQIRPLEVRTEDTCATACWLLGLPLPAYFDGKPVYEAFVPAR
ncbi:MAG TPA: ectonucleotide pyrophosphatase/phosphodiesterase [Opitutaceae bacterium]|nr:ectonucleotide pyrophosphatase/phosphodiesterase [Opitutaceae bacterium]